MSIQVLHVEVGGTFGGSLRALTTYLRHSAPNRIVHDLVLYYPTPGVEELRPWLRNLVVLCDVTPADVLNNAIKPPAWLPSGMRFSTVGQILAELQNWRGWMRILPTTRRIKKLLQEFNYDVVHVNNTFSYQVPTLIGAWRARKPVVAHVRNPIRNDALHRAIMRMADCVVTVTRSQAKELQDWGVPVRIETCYDGVDRPSIDKSVSRPLRESLVPPGGILIGSVGRLVEQKGYHDLIRAARRVVDQRPEVRFAIVGDGPLRTALEAFVAKLDLTDRFFLLGFRPDVGNFLDAIDLFVSSSHWEGGPLSVREALLLGKPIVATDAGDNADLIAPGRGGYLVPRGDPVALGDALLYALGRLTLPSNNKFSEQVSIESSSHLAALDDLFQQVAHERLARSHGLDDVSPSQMKGSHPEKGSCQDVQDQEASGGRAKS